MVLSLLNPASPPPILGKIPVAANSKKKPPVSQSSILSVFLSSRLNQAWALLSLTVVNVVQPEIDHFYVWQGLYEKESQFQVGKYIGFGA